jgi:hypothetical protein
MCNTDIKLSKLNFDIFFFHSSFIIYVNSNNIHSNNRDTLFSSTSKTDCHDITEVLLKVVLNTITLTPSPIHSNMTSFFHFVSKPAIYLPCKCLKLFYAMKFHKQKVYMKQSMVTIHSNMTSFFHFVSKPAIYLLCKLSLAHARSVHTFKPADKIMQ